MCRKEEKSLNNRHEENESFKKHMVRSKRINYYSAQLNNDEHSEDSEKPCKKIRSCVSCY